MNKSLYSNSEFSNSIQVAVGALVNQLVNFYPNQPSRLLQVTSTTRDLYFRDLVRRYKVIKYPFIVIEVVSQSRNDQHVSPFLARKIGYVAPQHRPLNSRHPTTQTDPGLETVRKLQYYPVLLELSVKFVADSMNDVYEYIDIARDASITKRFKFDLVDTDAQLSIPCSVSPPYDYTMPQIDNESDATPLFIQDSTWELKTMTGVITSVPIVRTIDLEYHFKGIEIPEQLTQATPEDSILISAPPRTL